MGKKTSKTEVTGPWGPLKAPMKDVIGRAGDLSNQQFYATPNENINTAFDQMIARSQDPNSGLAAAQSAFHRTAAGDYLDPDSNPYLRQTFDHASDAVMDRVNAEFSKAGRYGSQAHQRTMQDGLNRLATSIYAPAYNQERARQMQASAMMPQMGVADLALQLQGGRGLTSIEQREMDDPRAALMQYLQMLQGVNSGPMGQKTTYKGSLLDNIQQGVGIATDIGSMITGGADAYDAVKMAGMGG